MVDISLKWGNVWRNCDIICFRQECNNCQEFPWHCASGILNIIGIIYLYNLKTLRILIYFVGKRRSSKKATDTRMVVRYCRNTARRVFECSIVSSYTIIKFFVVKVIWPNEFDWLCDKSSSRNKICHSFPRHFLILAIHHPCKTTSHINSTISQSDWKLLHPNSFGKNIRSHI